MSGLKPQHRTKTTSKGNMPTEIELQDGWINPNPDLFVRTYRTEDGQKTGKHVVMKAKEESYWIVGFELPGKNIKWRSRFADSDSAMFDAYREVHELGLTYHPRENATSNTQP